MWWVTQEAWAVIQLHMTRESEEGREDISTASWGRTGIVSAPPHRYIFNSMLRAMGCMLIGMRGNARNQLGEKGDGRGGVLCLLHVSLTVLRVFKHAPKHGYA